MEKTTFIKQVRATSDEKLVVLLNLAKQKRQCYNNLGSGKRLRKSLLRRRQLSHVLPRLER